jgi:hypothetical protein
MPKNSSYELFCRWRALDAHLRAGSLHVPDFCARWRVSAKRVYADSALHWLQRQTQHRCRDIVGA